MIRKR